MPLCQRIDQVRVLFVGKVLETNDNYDGYIKGPIWYRVAVEESFKGLPAGVREVFVDPDSGTSCQTEYAVGTRYLFSSTLGQNRKAASYPRTKAKVPSGFYVSTGVCSGTLALDYAAEDLKFVREYTTNPQPAWLRVSVLRQPWLGTPDYPPILGVKLAVRGPGSQMNGVTDARGLAEFRPVEPGLYSVSADLPGYIARVNDFRGFGPLEVSVPRNGCGLLNIGMHTDARISGQVLRQDGSPAAGVKVEYAFADPRYRSSALENSSAKTDAQGRFELKRAPSGSVVVGVNLNNPPTPGQPYRTVFRTLRLSPNEVRSNVVIRLGAQLTERSVTVHPRFANGSIVDGAFVYARANGVQVDYTRSGPNGLTFRLLEGIEYAIAANNTVGLKQGEAPRSSLTSDWVRVPATGTQTIDVILDNVRPPSR